MRKELYSLVVVTAMLTITCCNTRDQVKRPNFITEYQREKTYDDTLKELNEEWRKEKENWPEKQKAWEAAKPDTVTLKQLENTKWILIKPICSKYYHNELEFHLKNLITICEFKRLHDTVRISNSYYLTKEKPDTFIYKNVGKVSKGCYIVCNNPKWSSPNIMKILSFKNDTLRCVENYIHEQQSIGRPYGWVEFVYIKK